MNQARVIKAGFFTSVQDLGRMGFRAMGVPVSGAMDQHSSALANLILNNDPEVAVIESTQIGPELIFDSATVIAITGAKVDLLLNGSTVSMNQAIAIHSGDVLSMGKCTHGLRSYLAIKGGFVTDEYLRSRSFCKGVSPKVCLQKGDALPYAECTSVSIQTNSRVKQLVINAQVSEIEVMHGPEWKWLCEDSKNQLVGQVFSVSAEQNRMGIRLQERWMIDQVLPGMLSSAVLPGTVQLTPNGQLIILMRDCQTTGGYPRVLQLTDKAINSMAQLISSSKIKFEWKS